MGRSGRKSFSSLLQHSFERLNVTETARGIRSASCSLFTTGREKNNTLNKLNLLCWILEKAV